MPTLQGNLSDLATLPTGRLLWRYSLPAVTGMVVMSLYNVIDRIYIGQGIDALAIAGLAVTFPVMNLSAAVGVLVGAGASARVSIHLGARRLDLAQRVLGNALTLTLVLGLAYILCFAVWIDPILKAFGASAATLPYARDFMLWLLPGMLMTNLTFSFNNIQRASGYPRRAMLTMVLSAAVNAALAPLFIFALDMGIRGAALATDLAMLTAMVFVMHHFRQPGVTLRFTPRTYRLDSRTVLAITGIGAAPALVNAAASLINMIVNTRLLHYGGDMAVGASGIITTYMTLMVMVVLGICQGMQPIVGYNYGAGNMHRLRRTYWLATGVSTAICVAGSAGAQLFPGHIARIFTADANLQADTVSALRTATWAFALVGFQIVSTNFFQSIGKPVQSIILSLSRQVIFLIPLLLILSGPLQVYGVWLSFPLSDLLATLVTAVLMYIQLKQLPTTR